MKKLIAISICTVLFLTSLQGVVAKNNNIYENEQNMAELLLKKMGVDSNVSNPKPLFNLYGDIESISFDIEKSGGYIIVNINDLSVPEFSIKNSSPFENGKEYIYNGPLAYVEKDANNIKNTSYIYHQPKLSQLTKTKKLEKLQSNNISNVLTRSLPFETDELSTTLKTWYKSGGYCGSIAAAIVLMFYDEVYSESYVAYSKESESILINHLIPYIDGATPGSSTSALTNGLNDYLDDIGKSKTAWSKSSFSKSTLTSAIHSNRPVIIDTDNHPTYKEHWIIAHGYAYSDDLGNYALVNDGWEENDVYVAINSYLDDMVFLDEF